MLKKAINDKAGMASLGNNLSILYNRRYEFKKAIDLLEKNPDNKSAISKLFGEMVSNNLRDPENIGKIQDGLYTARDARLKNANPNERLSILESFSVFMTHFTQ